MPNNEKQSVSVDADMNVSSSSSGLTSVQVTGSNAAFNSSRSSADIAVNAMESGVPAQQSESTSAGEHQQISALQQTASSSHAAMESQRHPKHRHKKPTQRTATSGSRQHSSHPQRHQLAYPANRPQRHLNYPASRPGPPQMQFTDYHANRFALHAQQHQQTFTGEYLPVGAIQQITATSSHTNHPQITATLFSPLAEHNVVRLNSQFSAAFASWTPPQLQHEQTFTGEHQPLRETSQHSMAISSHPQRSQLNCLSNQELIQFLHDFNARSALPPVHVLVNPANQLPTNFMIYVTRSANTPINPGSNHINLTVELRYTTTNSMDSSSLVMAYPGVQLHDQPSILHSPPSSDTGNSCPMSASAHSPVPEFLPSSLTNIRNIWSNVSASTQHSLSSLAGPVSQDTVRYITTTNFMSSTSTGLDVAIQRGVPLYIDHPAAFDALPSSSTSARNIWDSEFLSSSSHFRNSWSTSASTQSPSNAAQPSSQDIVRYSFQRPPSDSTLLYDHTDINRDPGPSAPCFFRRDHGPQQMQMRSREGSRSGATAI